VSCFKISSTKNTPFEAKNAMFRAKGVERGTERIHSPSPELSLLLGPNQAF